ncbi:MAG: O-antigen ligase family protein [Cellvibrionaceae bacterium]
MTTIGLLDWKYNYNPVVIGIYFGLISTMCLATLVKRPLTFNRPYWIWLFISIAMLAILGVTFLSRTRTALVGISFFIAVMLLIEKKYYTTFFLIAIGSICIVAGLIFDIAQIKSYVLRGGFGSWRPEIWQVSFNQSLDHFWIGSGMGSDTIYTVPREELVSTQNHSHNFYLQMFAWSGFTGLFLYVALILRSLVLGFKAKQLQLGYLALSCLTYFLAVQIFDVHNIFTASSYYWPCIWLHIGILLGLSDKIQKTSTKQTTHLSEPTQTLDIDSV